MSRFDDEWLSEYQKRQDAEKREAVHRREQRRENAASNAVALKAVLVSPLRPMKAPKKPRAPKPKGLKEQEIQKQILDWLETVPRLFAERQNTGVAYLKGKKGTMRPVSFSQLGAPDIRVCVRGAYLALEVKRPGEKQNENQLAWQADFERGEGIYRVVSSLEDAMKVVREIEKQQERLRRSATVASGLK